MGLHVCMYSLPLLPFIYHDKIYINGSNGRLYMQAHGNHSLLINHSYLSIYVCYVVPTSESKQGVKVQVLLHGPLELQA